MLQSFLYTLSETSLILGIFHLYLLYFQRETSPKKYALVCRFWIICSVLSSILFYNQSYNIFYFENNAYTLLFKLIIGILCYTLLTITATWFHTEKETGIKYYVLVLMAMVSINLMISSVNLLSLLISYITLILVNYKLLHISYQKLQSTIAPKYIGISTIIITIFLFGYLKLSQYLNYTPQFSLIKNLYDASGTNLEIYLTSVSITIPFLYSIGIAPFHILAEEKSGKAILPVSHYFSIIAPVAFWAVFLKLNIEVIEPYLNKMSIAFVLFGFMSLFYGAVGANSRINIHRIFAHASIYHFGIMLILVSFYKKEVFFSTFIYLLTYIIALNGIYLVLYSLKSHGEYLSSITSLSGLAKTRPYATRMLLISIFSFIGIPPLAGFLGQLTLLTDLIFEKSYIYLGIILFCFLFLSRAYLALIKIAYFEPKSKNYDTTNKTLKICMLINILLIVTMAFNPYNLLTFLQDMFYVAFI